MREPLLTGFAKWALMNIGKRVRKSSASSPGIGEGPNNQANEKGRVAPTKNDKDIAYIFHGDLEGEVFK